MGSHKRKPSQPLNERGNNERLFDIVRLVIFIISVWVYIILFLLFYPILGAGSSIFAFFPVATAGLLFGFRLGFIAGLAFIPINLWFVKVMGSDDWLINFILTALPGMIIVLISGMAVGHMTDLRKKMRDEQMERQDVEKNLKMTATLLQSTIESTGDGILVTDLEGQHITHNQGYLIIWNLPSLGDPEINIMFISTQTFLEQIKEPDRLKSHLQEIYLHPLQEQNILLELQDGRSIELHSRPLMVGNSIAGIVFNFHDITALKAKETSLMSSEDKFRRFIDHSLDGISQADESGILIDWNPLMERITGLSRKQVLGKPVWDVMFQIYPEALRTPAVYQEIRTWYQSVLISGSAAGINQPFEMPVHYLDGSQRVLQMISFAIPTGQGFRVGAIYRDITRQKQVEQRLRLMELVVTHVTNGIVITDPNQVGNPIVYVNPAFEDLTGYSAVEVYGRGPHFLVGPESDTVTSAQVENAINERRPTRVVTHNFRKDGTSFWNDVSIAPVFDQSNRLTHFVCILTDVTHLKDVEEKLRELSSHDKLTGLFNRTYFDQALAELKKNGPFPSSILSLDADRLKEINDLYGHAAGDETLCRIASILTDLFRDYDVVARIGGDEFAVLLPGLKDEAAQAVVKRLYARLAENNASQQGYPVSFSCGMVTVHSIGELEGVMIRADERMYVDKRYRRSRLSSRIDQDLSLSVIPSQSLLNEDRFRLLVDNASDIFFRYRLSPTPGFEYLSPAMQPITGYTQEDFYRDPSFYKSVVHPDDLERLHELRNVSESWNPQLSVRIITRGGSIVRLEYGFSPLFNEENEIVAVEGIARNVTRRLEIEHELTSNELRTRAFIDNSSEGISQVDEQGILIEWNLAMERITELKRSDVIGKPLWEVMYLLTANNDQAEIFTKEQIQLTMQKAMNQGQGDIHSFRREINIHLSSGQEKIIETVSFPIKTDKGLMMGVFIHDVSQRRSAEEALKRSDAITRTILNAFPDMAYLVDTNGKVLIANEAFGRWLGKSISELRGMSIAEALPEWMWKASQTGFEEVTRSGTVWQHEIASEDEYYDETIFPIFGEKGSVVRLAVFTREITSSKQRERELLAVVSTSAALRSALNPVEVYTIILDQVEELLQADGIALILRDVPTGTVTVEQARGAWHSLEGMRFSPEEATRSPILVLEEPYLNNDIQRDTRLFQTRPFAGLSATASCPLAVEGTVIGTLWFGRRAVITPEEVRILIALGDITANAIHRAQLFEQARRYANQLATATEIGQALARTLSLNEIYWRLADSVLRLLPGISAIYLWRYDPGKKQLICVYALLEEKPLDLANFPPMPCPPESRGPHCQVIRSGQELIINDMSHYLLRGDLEVPFRASGVTSSAALYIPMSAVGEVLGVLEVNSNAPNQFRPADAELLSLVGSTAAIAIQNASRFEDVTLAYESTLEAWARALDIRDEGTQGHTRRVVELAEDLGRRLGVVEKDLPNLRRGAQLHDIGKIGVPDSILLKTGPLTEGEWVIMRKHPLLAYQMLEPVPDFRPILDIPYCHHEWWNGGGYPRGIKGEEIPLVARIFSVVDVWDALISDRPYRRAWNTQQALAYIRSHSGTQFDPRVVGAFLAMVDSEFTTGSG